MTRVADPRRHRSLQLRRLARRDAQLLDVRAARPAELVVTMTYSTPLVPAHATTPLRVRLLMLAALGDEVADAAALQLVRSASPDDLARIRQQWAAGQRAGAWQTAREAASRRP